MRVMSKPEFDDSVRYSELELLLENFGVHRDDGQQESNQSEHIMEDESVSVNEPLRS